MLLPGTPFDRKKRTISREGMSGFLDSFNRIARVTNYHWIMLHYLSHITIETY